MSKVAYEHKPYKVIIVEYSFGSRSFKRPSYAQTEEEALKETKECVLWSRHEDFTMKIVEIKEY